MSTDLRHYLEQVVAENSSLQLSSVMPDLSQMGRVGVEDIYVPLTLDPGELTAETVLERHRQAVILGEPGSGKTTLLKYLSRSLALASLEKPGWIPIMMRAYEIAHLVYSFNADLSFANILAEYQRVYYPNLPERFLPVQFENGHCVLLIDGLDEILGSARPYIVRSIETTASRLAQNRYLATCRPAAYASMRLSNFAEFSVRSLSEETLTHFIQLYISAFSRKLRDDSSSQYLAEISNDLVEALSLNADIKALASNPLLLTIFIITYIRSKGLPAQKVELYQNIVDALLEGRELNKGLPAHIPISMEDIERALAKAAWQMQLERRESVDRHELAVFLGNGGGLRNSKSLPIELLLSIGERGGLLVEPEPDSVRFAHLSFQEYFAAHWLVSRPEKDLREYVRQYGDDPYWREVFVFTAGLLSDATPLIEALLDDALVGVRENQVVYAPGVGGDTGTSKVQYRLALAADCAASARRLSDPLRERLENMSAHVRLSATHSLAWGSSDELLTRAMFAHQLGNIRLAADLYTRWLARSTPQSGSESDVSQIAEVQYRLGSCLLKLDRSHEALEVLQSAEAKFRQQGNIERRADALLALGIVYQSLTDYELARWHYKDAQRLYQRLNSRRGIAAARANLGRLEFETGSLEQAKRHLHEAIEYYLFARDETNANQLRTLLDRARERLAHRSGRKKEIT